MDTKTLSITIIFAAATIALSLSGFAIPAFYATYLFYQIWEIPIVTAFVLINKKAAIFIALLNAVVLISFLPGATLLGPIYNLMALLSTLFGIMIVANLFDAGLYDTEFIRLIALFGIACMAIGSYIYKPKNSPENESELPKDETGIE